ncbi:MULTISPECIES: dihydrodipicolinate synthase family protein [unclassified Paenibacillus]|uniref:dihydrodipicolinate synthase family protein n=1 Tax=unclassified Paenibacillus TaxID=185978 RepID=UPI001052878E|nr:MULTISPECIES: dihydrodipicolinate synthase family protein [unclassified Paenibacillus]NIK68696.1 4-hydroxy-tetrahydrodipicolinate synthase [Paenibacillus sp. BK720]TCM99019.1 4-hydroxy-tetrahydrodipicolinate synthase [Paenibacillus sp. BK033]
MSTFRFSPYSVAIITPFRQDDTIDEQGIHHLVRYYWEHQVPALLVGGSTGEQHSLSLEERRSLYRLTRQAASAEFPLYAGVAAIRTRDAVQLALEAEKAGQTAIMLGFPPYVRPSQREAAIYAEAVCSATALPVMLYNNPVRTGFNLEPQTLISLARRFPQIRALKEAGNPDVVKGIRDELGEDFQVLSGIDSTIVDYSAKGYTGLTSVAGNLFPNELKEIVGLLGSGQLEEAALMLNPLRPKLELLGSIGWVRVIRHRLAAQGIVAGGFREPLTPLTAEEAAAVTNVLH